MQVIEVDPKKCKRWYLADRSGFEFGNIYALAEDIKKNGQVEPILVRPYTKEEGIEYEVIAGSRRWKACSDANIPLKAIVQNLSDEEAAIAQIKENQQLSICDYSKGIYYSKILKGKTMTLAKLSENVGYSKAKMENFLSFERVPTIIWDEVGNLSKVSSRTASAINALAQKGKEYINAIVDLAEDVRKGMGCTLLEKKVMTAVHGYKEDLDDQQEVQLASGQTIAVWTKHGLQFSKNIPFNKKDFEKELIRYFENSLKEKRNSVRKTA